MFPQLFPLLEDVCSDFIYLGGSGEMWKIMLPLVHSVNCDREILFRLTFCFRAVLLILLSFSPVCVRIEKHISLNKCYVSVTDYPATEDANYDMSIVELHKSDVYVSIIKFISLRLN